MLQDPFDDVGLVAERDDVQVGAAVGAFERVDLVDFLNQPGHVVAKRISTAAAFCKIRITIRFVRNRLIIVFDSIPRTAYAPRSDRGQVKLLPGQCRLTAVCGNDPRLRLFDRRQ